MRPRLATPDDVRALWEHLGDTVDCIATDHAPHTLAEKHGPNPPPGVPGLETALPLMLTAVRDGRLSFERMVALMATNPRRIYQLPDQPDTRVEVEADDAYAIDAANLYTKCGWTPFAGMAVTGRVTRVIVRGEPVVEDGRVLAAAGSGKVISA
jgi:carbamoyl-phosphate synthase/aspartate carbamoyltransferase/dihydroorotase